MSSEHAWGTPDTIGVQMCVRPGCTVKRNVRDDGTVSWQPKKGAHWRFARLAPIPPCDGTRSK